jgi:general secretion pathway protein A
MEDFFGLSGRPFAAAPRTDRYFPAASIEAARTTLVRAVERSEGPAIVIGPVGTGKTLLLRLLAQQFASTFRVATLAAGRIHSRRTLWQALLYELGLPYRGMDDGELRLAVVGHLTGPQASDKHALLLVDEAHALTPRLLDELRALADLSRDGQPAVRLILAGGPSLEEHFAHPKLEAFAQRLAARCYLEPYSRDDTVAFIHAQVAACDSSADALFHEEAFDAVHRATDGVPRLINQVCDHALVLAYADGLTDISAELIELAWADLQQLPAPWSVPEPMSSRRPGGAIEFGRLEDDEDAAFEPDEMPSVRFPTERIDRRAAGDAAIVGASLDLSSDAIDDDSLADGDEFAIHSPDEDGALDPVGDYETADTGTEIEITVAETAVDPFAEPFAEEVAVVDRVAAIDRTRPNKKPVAPPPRPTPRPTLTATASPSATPAVAESTTYTAPTPNVAVAAFSPPQTSPASWPSANPAALHPAASVGAPRDFTPKKPRKYSQLFSQLRRNSG